MKHNTNPISPQSPKSRPPGLYKKTHKYKMVCPSDDQYMSYCFFVLIGDWCSQAPTNGFLCSR